MGCFFTCFGISKHKRRRNIAYAVPKEDQIPVRTQSSSEQKLTNVVKESSKEKHEKQLNSTTKKVTFDLNIKVYEDICGDSVQRNDESDHEKKEETQKETLVEPGLIKTCPSKHRYTNCELNDEDDCENTQLESSDRNNEERHQSLVQEESSESLFSLSIGSKTQVSSSVETGDKEVSSPLSIQGSNPNERDRSHYFHHVPSNVETGDVNSPISIRGSKQNARDRSRYVHHVLNPVENLTQWKEIKARARPSTSKHQAKENISLEDKLKIPCSPEPSYKVSSLNFKPNSNDPKCFGEETTVETSLSSWLNESEMTPNCRSCSISVGNSSPNSLEDRLALTEKEIKHFSASSFRNGSQCKSMEENPVTRTVGSYWSHTGQALGSTDSESSCHGVPNTTSKYQEDKSVTWRSTPFEARLERALNSGVAKV